MSERKGQYRNPSHFFMGRYEGKPSQRGVKCPVCGRQAVQAVYNQSRKRYEFKHSSKQGFTRTRYCFGERVE